MTKYILKKDLPNADKGAEVRFYPVQDTHLISKYRTIIVRDNIYKAMVDVLIETKKIEEWVEEVEEVEEPETEMKCGQDLLKKVKLTKENIKLQDRIASLEIIQSLDRDTINERNKTIQELRDKLNNALLQSKKKEPRQWYALVNRPGLPNYLFVHYDIAEGFQREEGGELIQVREVIK